MPDYISIPVPEKFKRGRGRQSTGLYTDCILRARVTRDQRDNISLAAAKLNMSVANFIRWCASKAAEELLK